MQIYRYQTFVLMVICWFFFNLASKYWMIDWYSTPMLALFQIYRGVRNIGKNYIEISMLSSYSFSSLGVFFLFLSLFILYTRYISSINQFRFLHPFPRFFNWICWDGSDDVAFFCFSINFTDIYIIIVILMVLLT